MVETGGYHRTIKGAINMDYKTMWFHMKQYLLDRNERDILFYMIEEELINFYDVNKKEKLMESEEVHG